MPRPTKPRGPFGTIEARLTRIEYLVYRICETLKIDYDLKHG
jgi:hypothetical protein